jgi:hypothetical protein
MSKAHLQQQLDDFHVSVSRCNVKGRALAVTESVHITSRAD